MSKSVLLMFFTRNFMVSSLTWRSLIHLFLYMMWAKFLVLSFLKIIYQLFGWTGSSLLCAGFLQLQWTGATLFCSAQTSCCSGFSCTAQALGTQPSVTVTQGLISRGSQALECMSSVAVVYGLSCLQHVESSWARDQTCVPYTGRQIPIDCTTREIL